MRLILAISCLFFATLAHADWRFEATGGGCQYTAVGDGIWWNAKYEHELDMRHSCGFLAVSKMTGNEGWRLAYVDLGGARVNAVFPMIDSEQALPAFDGSSCNPSTLSGCLGRSVGVQQARGLSLGYVLEDAIGPVTLGIEAGAFVYSGTWDVHITGAFGSIDMHWQGIQATPYLGTTLRYGYLFATARAYGRIRANEHGCGGCSGVAGGNAAQVLVGLSIPF